MSQNNSLKQLNNKKIALLGFGLDNQALLALLNTAKIHADITICDARPLASLANAKSAYSKINYQLGKNFNKNLDKFDILFRSPGWPVSCPGIQATRKNGQTELSSPLNLFFDLARQKILSALPALKAKARPRL